MEKITPVERYQLEIYQYLADAFDPENEDQKWKLSEIDATAWFTGLVKACGFLYNKLTDDDKTYFEFTHLAQNLIVQEMVEKKNAA